MFDHVLQRFLDGHEQFVTDRQAETAVRSFNLNVEVARKKAEERP